MATEKQRAWYVDKLSRIGIVEKGSNVTKDGVTTNWNSISSIKAMKIYAISKDTDLAITRSDADGDDLSVTFGNIPAQFHEIILFKVIAAGYKDPRNIDINTAQYFDGEYALGVKEGKKFSRSNYQTTGFIKPQAY